MGNKWLDKNTVGKIRVVHTSGNYDNPGSGTQNYLPDPDPTHPVNPHMIDPAPIPYPHPIMDTMNPLDNKMIPPYVPPKKLTNWIELYGDGGRISDRQGWLSYYNTK